LDSPNNNPDSELSKELNSILQDEKSKLLSNCDKFMKEETINDGNKQKEYSFFPFDEENCKIIYDAKDNNKLLQDITEFTKTVREQSFMLEGLTNVLKKLQDKGKNIKRSMRFIMDNY